MGSRNSIKVDVGSLTPLFNGVEDKDGDGYLSRGDVIDDGTIHLVKTKEGHVEFQSGFEVVEGDVASLESLTQMLHDRTGRLVRVLKSGGLFAQNSYLAWSYADSTDIEQLTRIGRTGCGQKDLADERLDLNRSSHAPRETFVPEDIDLSGSTTLPQYKTEERAKTASDKVADRKNDAVHSLMANWFFQDKESLRATGAALNKIESAIKKLIRLNAKT